MAGGRLGLGELAATIALSPSGLSKLLDRMDASGLIRREPGPDDQSDLADLSRIMRKLDTTTPR